MINPEDETIIVNSLSCSKDVAVAKMLGWMRGPVRLKYIKMASTGIQPDQLEHLHSIEGSILDFLNEQRQFARDSLQAIADEAAATEDVDRKNAIYELINQHDDAIVTWQALTVKASTYLNAIDTELAKGKNSTLKTDDSSIDNDAPLIMLDSLDKWAKANFGITVREEFDVAESALNSAYKEPQRRDALRIEIEAIVKTMTRPTPSKVMAALRAKVGGFDTCIRGNVGDGLQWENDKGDIKVITIKALSERLKTLRNPE